MTTDRRLSTRSGQMSLRIADVQRSAPGVMYLDVTACGERTAYRYRKVDANT
jgi:hypothetical protein